MFTTPTFRTVAASGALALVATSGALLASPATAAESATLNYDCNSPALGDFAVTAKHATPASNELVYGGDITVTTTMTLSPETVGGLNFFGIKAVEGTATNNALAAGLLPVEIAHTIAKTDVPATGSMDLVAIGDVATAEYAEGGLVKTGDSVSVAMNDIEGADIAAQLYTYNAAGERGGPVPVNCELADGQELGVGSVTVVQADTKTTAKLAYKAKKKKMIAKVTVDAPESGVTPAGKVKVTLKRNGKKFAAKTVTLNAKGKASAAFTKIKKGKYKVIASYAGDANFDNSKGSAVKKV